MSDPLESVTLLRNLCGYLLRHVPQLRGVAVVFHWEDARLNEQVPGFCLQPDQNSQAVLAMLEQSQALTTTLLQRAQQKQGPAHEPEAKAEQPAGSQPVQPAADAEDSRVALPADR